MRWREDWCGAERRVEDINLSTYWVLLDIILIYLCFYTYWVFTDRFYFQILP